MKNFKFVSFKDDLLKMVITENGESGSLFILPSFISKSRVQKLFQQEYGIRNIAFYTMDELKENHFIASAPFLKEDKRNLALYGILNKSDKEYFHINDYFDSITFARNFFDFYQELSEEFVSRKDIIKVFEESFSDTQSQRKTYEKLEKIKEKYRNYLIKNSLSDKIFIYSKDNLNIKKYSKVIVVNQFYFTKLEKFILDSFENVIYYFQVPQDLYDKKNMTLQENFGAIHLQDIASKKISFKVSEDYVSMNLSLMKDILQYNKATIVDFEFKDNPRFAFLNRNLFSANLDNFTTISLYGFLQQIQKLLSSIKNGMISFKSFFEAWQNISFRNYFMADEMDEEEVLLSIYKKNANNYRYFDRNLVENENLIFEDIFDFIESLLKIGTLNEFIFLFKDKIKIENILTNEEKQFSDAVTVFYQALYDIKSIENLHGINDVLNDTNEPPVVFFIKLLLNHLKAKKIRRNIENHQKKYIITSLLDTRNFSFERIFITDLINGKIPSPQKTRFLFTEIQREKLGLITYQKIRLREKYYLYRLIASSKYVHLFSISDIEENIEVSSFIEEFLHDIPDKSLLAITKKPKEKLSYTNLYSHLLTPSNYTAPSINKVFSDLLFFKFVHRKSQLEKLSLSPSKYIMIKNSPFIYYLRYFLNVPENETDFPDDFRGNFLGQFIHKVFAALFHRISEVYKFGKINDKLLYNKKLYIENSYNHTILSDKHIKYKLTYSQADSYFNTFYKKFMIMSLDTFVSICYNLLKDKKNIKFIPETDKRIHSYKSLGKIEDSNVEITGISDLRIETASKNYIVDFKTGSKESYSLYKEQLKFYEAYYYSDTVKEIESFFYFVSDQYLRPLSEKDKKLILTDIIQKLIQDLRANGFLASDKKTYFSDFDITRIDRKI